MTLYLSRARLKRSPSIAAIGKLLLPEDRAARVNAAHHLIWSLFAGDPAQKRHFLWREDQAGQFFILSAAPPATSEIFDTDTKEYAPALGAGDRLAFTLRAYATKSWKPVAGTRGVRTDVVMAALHGVIKEDRAAQRAAITTQAGVTWLVREGAAHGFTLAGTPLVVGDQAIAQPRAGTRGNIRSLDFSGVLEVTDPEKFMAKLAAGFGRARSFGCGLMLIRRA
jgi:CRISPR system Cascade subunit CasE